MNKLQLLFDEIFSALFRPEDILTELLRKRFFDLGIELTVDQLAKFKSHFAGINKGDIRLDFQKDQILKAGFNNEEHLQAALATLPQNLLADANNFENVVFDKLSVDISDLPDKLSAEILVQLKRDSQNLLKKRHNYISSFEKGLLEIWGNALNILEMLILISFEVGDSFNEEHRRKSAEINDYVFEVLSRLHARSCQIAFEILTLLKSGYADGAIARWRSLHEIAVITYFITDDKSNNNKLAERYVLYDNIESFKAAKAYQKHCKKLGFEPLNENEFKAINDAYTHLIHRFGKNYGKEYGWASSVINEPNFFKIEQMVLEHLRPYYNMACYNIHAGPRGIYFKLGLEPGAPPQLLAGPSNVGLTDPANLTALSLTQITSSYLTHKTNLDVLVYCNIMKTLMHEVESAVKEAEESLAKSVV